MVTRSGMVRSGVACICIHLMPTHHRGVQIIHEGWFHGSSGALQPEFGELY